MRAVTSEFGTNRTNRAGPAMSVNRGISEVGFRVRQVAFW